MSLATGDMLYVYCSQVNNNKFVICICPKNFYCFLINTEPRKTSPDAQIEIKKSEYPFLKHNSFINTAFVVKIPPDDMTKGKKLGILKTAMKNKIKDVVGESKYLSDKYKNIVLSNLG